MTDKEPTDQVQPPKSPDLGKKHKGLRRFGAAALGAVFAAGIGVMGHEMHNDLYEDASGKVTSVKLVDTPGSGSIGEDDYVVEFVTEDGKKVTATCGEAICDNVHAGDTIEADLDKETDRLVRKYVSVEIVTKRG